MSPAYLLYNAILHLALPVAAAGAALRGRLQGHWPQRLGLAPRLTRSNRGRVWIHAASVGEVRVAASLIQALTKRAPDLTIWLTATTSTGLSAARSSLPCPVFAFPLDAFGSPGRALSRLQPDLVIVLETELWPNFLKAAKEGGAKVMLANGRISIRSVKGYRKVGFLIREVLEHLDLMAMIRPEDADRIISLGASPARVRVEGNAKYDLLWERADFERLEYFRRSLGLDRARPVLVAGSTRSGEEAQVLEAYLRLRDEFPNLHLIIAPRHVERSREIENLIRRRGCSWARRTRADQTPLPAPDVTLVDVMGELFFLYGLANAAFCGGSLVKRGGQNPLEPAVWGVPVLYGPSMEDFLDARELLEASGAGRAVTGPDDLYEAVRELLADSEKARSLGQAGRRALAGHQGAAGRLADLALNLLAMDKGRPTCY
ncbi:MAG: 3-deoxy-D-manno-octulosonic acid transferase [Thermodesulfobacteriota bacterium]